MALSQNRDVDMIVQWVDDVATVDLKEKESPLYVDIPLKRLWQT